MKNKSFIREIFLYLLMLTGLLFVALGIVFFSTYQILEKELKDSSDAFLKIYSNEIKNTISDLDGTLKKITSQGEDLAKIKSKSENERSLSAISLHNYLIDLISNNDIPDAIVVYDNNFDICLDAISTNVKYKQKQELRETTCNALKNTEIKSITWNFISLGERMYLYKALKTEDRVIVVYVDTKELLAQLLDDDIGNRTIVLTDGMNRIGKLWGMEKDDIAVGKCVSEVSSENYYRVNQSIVSGQLSLWCFTGKADIFKQTNTNMVVVAISVGVAFLFMLFLFAYTRKEVIFPMKVMINDMEKIRDGEYDNRIDDDFRTKEFRMLKETTNQMVDEIVGLKIQSYEKRIELQDMELKSIRLQLKPHFFLNALTTISSLGSQNKMEQIRIYIEALSRNVRYMFRAGFHTVPVKEEVRHVKNYFEMQELKYPDCVFYFIDLPESLEEWKIPQMLIHTFIENEYKYAVSIDNVLTILIKIRKEMYQGEEMLLIEVEDDGKGYPIEVLEYMNDKTKNVSDKGTRVGLWSIKRMMELMYDTKNLVIVENISPHGCLNRIYIPREAKHELVDDNIQTRI